MLLVSCSKQDDRVPTPAPGALGSFSVTVSSRLPASVQLQWSVSVNANNTDTVKYKVEWQGNVIASDLTTRTYTVTGLQPATSYAGRILAYTSSGDTASASFAVGIYTAPASPYSYVTGFYRVTESTKILSSGAIRQFTFAAQATLINDSTIQFTQTRRNPRTWWTVDFPTVIYPAQGDSLIGSGITPRGRILNQNTIRMGYLYGSSVVYQVQQLWEKLANPADTATIVYTYPSVPFMITTLAGNNTSGSGSGSSGDGGLATAASLLNPNDVTVDASGNVYLTDGGTTYSIRKVSPDGLITRFAGNNTSGFSGDGGPASAAALNFPQGLVMDNAGNLLISDGGNRVIRKVNPSGIISTIAGTPGTYGYSGDGGLATAAQMGFPCGLCVDATGAIYVADAGKHVIRRISASGIISTVAGTGVAGYSGNGGPATSAQLSAPTDVSVDASGNLYIADRDNHCIRKISTSGIISTVAGLGGSLNYGFTGDGGPATSAKLNKPNSVSADASGNLYISDYTNNRIRKVNSSGTISTFAGNGQSSVLGDGPAFYGGDYGPATSASLFAPYGHFATSSTLYVASSYRIRAIRLQ